MVFMSSSSSSSGSSKLSRLNHPQLTDLIYNNASQPPCTHTYNGRALTLPRGTRGFIEFAKLRGFLPSTSKQNNQQDLVPKKLSLFENVMKNVQLHMVGFLDSQARASFFQTTSSFHNLKEASLKERSDLISKLIKHVNGDVRTLHSDDIAVLKEISWSITSLNLPNIPFTAQKLEAIERLFPYLQEIDITSLNLSGSPVTPEKLEDIARRFPHLQKLNLDNCRITDDCLVKLKPLRPTLSELHVRNCDITIIGTRIIAEFFLSHTPYFR
jgi:hypothetical protein